MRNMIFWGMTLCLILAGCRREFPAESIPSGPVKIEPDYAGTVLPVNLAPIHFQILEPGKEYLTKVEANGKTILCPGKITVVSPKKWAFLCDSGKETIVTFTVAVKTDQNEWRTYDPFSVTLSPDKIDPWIVYRLIDPGYEQYGRLTLNQRCLENFDEKTFFDARSGADDQCVNCHNFQNRDPEQFLFHIRIRDRGTVFVDHGKIEKKMLKLPVGQLQYPAYHPSLPIVMFSSNRTRQLFFQRDLRKLDVYDSYSDLYFYNKETEEIRPVLTDENEQETFPSWSDDGKRLFYISAHLPLPPFDFNALDESINIRDRLATRQFDQFHYNLYTMTFDPETTQFGQPELLLDAAAENKSVIYPRLSPDGKYLVYCIADFGTFPIEHPESELELYNMLTGERRLLTEINSDKAESHHCWDSSGKWLMFASRRGDGLHTRIYMAHFNSETAQFAKPFLLPQDDPNLNRTRLYSYNIPEFLTGPIRLSPAKIAKEAQKQAQ